MSQDSSEGNRDLVISHNKDRVQLGSLSLVSVSHFCCPNFIQVARLAKMLGQVSKGLMHFLGCSWIRDSKLKEWTQLL